MSISHVEYHVSDLAKAVAFYEGLFGWRFSRYSDSYQMAKPQGGEGSPVVGLVRKDQPMVTPVANVFVTVANIEQSLTHIDNIVVGKTLIPDYGYYAQVADPDGNVIGLFEELANG